MISQLTRQPKNDSLAIRFVHWLVTIARFMLRLASIGDKRNP